MAAAEGVRQRKSSATAAARQPAVAPRGGGGLLTVVSPQLWVALVTMCVAFFVAHHFFGDDFTMPERPTTPKRAEPGVFTKNDVAKEEEVKEFKLHESAVGGPGIRLVTKEELATHGADAETVWLAVLGQVFDVTRGADRFYGPNKGYDHFAGIDGSKAFISGDFEPAGLTDDVEDMGAGGLAGLNNWRDFYHSDYTFVGNLVGGRFYGKGGEPTPMVSRVLDALQQAAQEEEDRKEQERLRPSCNTRWSQDDGGEVWCTSGVPRKATVPKRGGGTMEKCQCFQETGFSDHRKIYPGCTPIDTRCKTS